MLFTGMLLAVACDSKDEAVVIPDLNPILKGNYWTEKTYPIVMQDGQAVVSKDKSLLELQEAVGIKNDKTFPTFDEDLRTFYIRADGVIRKYTAKTETNWRVKVLPNAYKLEYDPTLKVLRLTATRDKLMNGWFADSELKPVSATEKKIIFEAPVKEYTREDLGFGPEVIGLQTEWNLIENPKDGGRWGADLTSCDLLTGY